jgi:cytochrome c553
MPPIHHLPPKPLHLLLTACSLLLAPLASAAQQSEDLYQQNCAACHGADRLGLVGPALLPENLKRLRKKAAIETITAGRPATQMPPFGDKLTAAEIAALADHIYQPLPEVPRWGAAEIGKSHTQFTPLDTLPESPQHNADPLNLFFVVEAGDHHATILDGDRLEPITRFKTRFALHGGAKYSPDGRFVYYATRDGWVTLFDLHSMQQVAEIRAGINTRNIAISGDGKLVAVGNYLPHNLVLLNADDLSLNTIVPVQSGAESSRVSAVYDATPRKSFILALKDLPEIWEIPYEAGKSGGWQHDYRAGQAEGNPRFTPRKIRLESPLDDFFFDQEYVFLMGASRSGGGAVIDLDLGRKVADLALDGMPHLGSGITWWRAEQQIMATPNLRKGALTVIDMKSWKAVDEIKTEGPGFFMRSHENSRYAWADVFFGPNRDLVHIIDKQSLEIVKTVRPAPGKTAAHIEFTRDGRYALLSIWEEDGALVVYDGDTLEEVKRIPMKKPVGKYNVYNKITRSEGTSH